MTSPRINNSPLKMLHWVSQTSVGLSIFTLSLAIYIITLAPDLIWGDSADFARIVYSLKLTNLTIGTADAHPIYLIIGKFFSWLPGDLPWNLNLMSAFFAALAVLLVFKITLKLTNSIPAGTIASAALCFSHAFWLHAVIAEVYTINGFLVALLIFLMLKWRDEQNDKWLVITALSFIIGLANHLILVLILPALLYFPLATSPRVLLKKRFLSIMLALLVLGMILILSFPHFFKSKLVKLIYGPPPILHYFFLPRNVNVFFREVFFYFAYLFYQFPIMGFVLGFIGVLGLLKKDFKSGLFLLLVIGINALFFIKTTLWKSLGGTKYTFYISDYVIFSIFIGCGAHLVLEFLALRKLAIKRKIGIFPNRNILFTKHFWATFLFVSLIPVTTYNLTPLMLEKLDLDLLHARDIPYRDNNTFFLIPSKRGYDGARKFGENTLRVVKPNSIIIADYTPYSVLKYLQAVEGERLDVKLIRTGRRRSRYLREIVSENLGRYHVYIADINEDSHYYNYAFIPKNSRFVPVGPIYEIIGGNSYD